MKSKKREQIKIEKMKYYPDAKVSCSCGASFNVGSTQEKIEVEVCSACHPYYTGTQKLVDTSGRVDKFKERLAKQEKMNKSKKQSVKVDAQGKTKPKSDLKTVDIKDLKKKGSK